MEAPKYQRMDYERADLTSIRLAVMKRRIVKFGYRGEEVRGEPHVLGHAIRTRSYRLKVYDLGTNSWRYFSFCDIRDFRCLPEVFAIRPEFRDGERKIAVVDTLARLS